MIFPQNNTGEVKLVSSGVVKKEDLDLLTWDSVLIGNTGSNLDYILPNVG